MKRILMRGIVLSLAASFISLVLAASSGKIHVLAVNGDLEGVKRLLKAHPKLLESKVEYSGVTPLSCACMATNDNQEVIKYLIKMGANLNSRSRSGLSPLHIAAMRGRHEIVRILLAHGADPNLRDNDNYTPLMKTLEDIIFSLETIEILLPVTTVTKEDILSMESFVHALENVLPTLRQARRKKLDRIKSFHSREH